MILHHLHPHHHLLLSPHPFALYSQKTAYDTSPGEEKSLFLLVGVLEDAGFRVTWLEPAPAPTAQAPA